jgi:hypothetical protein
MTITGTSHFTSRAAAVAYYVPYHYPIASEAVDDMLARGEIHIGEPTLRPGERLVLLDGGRRFGIEAP